MRSRELRVLRRGNELLEIHAGDHGVPEGAAAAHHRQSQHSLARAPARLSRLYRRQAFRRFGQSHRRAPHHRAVHVDRLYAQRAQHSLSAAQDSPRSSSAPASIRPAIPARRWPTCWSTIRATNCSRSTKTRSINFALAILQLDERPRVRVLARRDRFDRFVSVLVYVPRERYDSHIRAKIGAYLASAFIGRVSAFYPFFPEKVRWCACTSSSAAPAARRPRSSGQRSSSEVAAIIRTWSDGLGEALALVNPPDKARELFARYRDAFSAGLPRSLCAGDCGRRYSRHRRTLATSARSASISITGWKKTNAASA